MDTVYNTLEYTTGEGNFWDSENLADQATRGLLHLLAEHYIGKKSHYQRIKPRIESEDITWLKGGGIYIPPGDRETFFRFIDYQNDGYEIFSSYIQFNNEPTKPNMTVYTLREIDKLPKKFMSTGGNFKKYKFISYEFYDENIATPVIKRRFYTTNEEGRLFHVLERGEKMMSNMHIGLALPAITYGLYGDRKHLWNIITTDEEKNGFPISLTFGVYEEHIKSLLYARDNPKTNTGRKKPILHWVSSHKRRLNKGIDVDVKRHLRGVRTLEMEGMKFTINRPAKQ